MATPTRSIGRSGVHAAFKSPLRPQGTSNITTTPERSILKKQTTPTILSSPTECRPTKPTEIEAEIKQLTLELMKSRQEPLNIAQELKQWRERMHEYNEAKDACLIIFGHLAHAKDCLVRDLYMQYGLELGE